MKLLTVTIPCYNSSEYMEKSIRSALTGGNRVEIIVVDDGSSDNTLEIANKYQKKFPDIIKVVHQENGGHGEAVNTGIKNATGLYFKVLDSDDCLGKKALEKVLDLLEDMVSKDAGLDMLVSNFMYDKQGTKHKKIMKYKSAMPVNRMFGMGRIKIRHDTVSFNAFSNLPYKNIKGMWNGHFRSIHFMLTTFMYSSHCHM